MKRRLTVLKRIFSISQIGEWWK